MLLASYSNFYFSSCAVVYRWEQLSIQCADWAKKVQNRTQIMGTGFKSEVPFSSENAEKLVTAPKSPQRGV